MRKGHLAWLVSQPTYGAGMAEHASRADGYHRGTVPLNVVVPDRPRELVVVALDVWYHAAVLRGTATIDRAKPFWAPHSWAIATDGGAPSLARGGGGGHWWSWHFEPAIPDDARELGVYIGPDSERRPPAELSLAEPTVTAGLAGWPTTPVPAAAVLDSAVEAGPRTGPSPDIETGSVRPIEVIALNARLEDVVGRDLNVLWIVQAPFTPALARDARSLALRFPNPFGSGVIHTQVAVPA